MKTYRLTDRNHPQANQQFYGAKFFVNNLNEYVEVAPEYEALAAKDWNLQDMAASPLFEEAEQIIIGYNNLGQAITAWK